jgi:hypothetical protein
MTARLAELPLARAQLLAAIAAVPAGVKLGIPQLRDALVSQADVLAALQRLVDEGALDAATLRAPLEARANSQPPARISGGPIQPNRRASSLSDAPIQPNRRAGERVSGAALAAELTDYAKRHGLALSRVGAHVFGNKSIIMRLRHPGRVPQQRTIAKARAFLSAPPPPGLEPRPAGGARIADCGATGAELADELEAMIAEHQLSKTAVGLHLYGHRSGVDVLRRSNPRRSTVAKVRALLADPPLDRLRGKSSRNGVAAADGGGDGEPARRERPSTAAPALRGAQSPERVIDVPRRVPPSPPQAVAEPRRVEGPAPTFLSPAERAWCGQCEALKSGAAAAKCTSPWCKLKEGKAA